MSIPPPSFTLPSAAELDRLRLAADPLADDVVARITGDWEDPPLPAEHAAVAQRFARLACATRLLDTLPANGALAGWAPAPDPRFPDIAAVLAAYVAAAQALPAWTDGGQVARAEQTFFSYGLLSCTVQFCAALPECYVAPDLSTVLRITGQLVQHTDHRVRATAAMLFPVMMKGGLAQADGFGVRQVLKVRLIHAVVRNLILHGHPSQARPLLAALRTPDPQAGMFEALYNHGWDLGAEGLPCNQEELAYILLTFGYVYLRSLRRLGLGLPPDDEAAYLHCWNVAGTLLGVDQRLMAWTPDDAQALFALLQQRARARPHQPDPRPALGQALMADIAANTPLPLLKPWGTLMTRTLCGAQTARDIGIDGAQPLPARLIFALVMGLARGIDALVRLLVPGFSIVRFLTRLVGYPLVARYLMSQTRPLALPQESQQQINAMLARWDSDPQAPAWMNRLERRWTGRAA